MVKKQYPSAVDYANFMGKYSRCVLVVCMCVSVCLHVGMHVFMFVCLSFEVMGKYSSCAHVSVHVSACMSAVFCLCVCLWVCECGCASQRVYCVHALPTEKYVRQIPAGDYCSLCLHKMTTTSPNIIPPPFPIPISFLAQLPFQFPIPL